MGGTEATVGNQLVVVEPIVGRRGKFERKLHLAVLGRTGMIGAAIEFVSARREEEFMAIDESKLSKAQVRKLNALRKSVGVELGDEVFGKWLAQQAKEAAGPKPDPVALKIEKALDGFASDRSFKLGNYGYTIRRARGKGASGFVASKTKSGDKWWSRGIDSARGRRESDRS